MRLNAWDGHKPRKPFIVPVFIPHAGCPHRCVFCNQKAITRGSPSLPSTERLRADIDRFLRHRGQDRQPAQISFYGGNFLGLASSRIESLLSDAAEYIRAGKAKSLRFSTRPDTIAPQQLDLLKPYPVTDVELGAQSMNDAVLARSRRGHTAADTERAVGLLKKQGYRIGLQMMVGLPGDSVGTAMNTGRRIAALRPDFVRIYPTVVLRGSPLARWYRSGRYDPPSLEETVTLVTDLFRLFMDQQIPVIRMGLQADGDLQPGAAVLAGPYHPAFGHLVHARRFLDAAMYLIRAHAAGREGVSIEIHPRNDSKMRGIRNRNIEILECMLHLKNLKIIRNEAVPETEIHLIRRSSRYRYTLGDHRAGFNQAPSEIAQGGDNVEQQHL